MIGANFCIGIAIKEIRHFQSQTGLLIPRASFDRLVRGCSANIGMADDLRWSKSAIDALQEVCEHMLVTELSSAAFAMRNAKRVTLKPSDMEVVRDIRMNTVGYSIHRNESSSARPRISYPNRPVNKRQANPPAANNPTTTNPGSSSNNAGPSRKASAPQKRVTPNWGKQSSRYRGGAPGNA
jgi:histone H3/H4